MATNPFHIKWNKVKTDHFKIIFPNGLDSIANRTANVLESNYLPVSNSLRKAPRPISVILQNQNTISNGFVTYTPRHSEFFITPPQDYTLLGTNNWLDLLAKHEFRHVVQYDKALEGPGKYLQWVIGNYGISSLAHVTIPDWFWEGDAVGIETSHSLSGRGAIPNFSMLMRSQLVDYEKPFSYSKAAGRSFKSNIPNHYVLGYALTSYMKNKYGYDTWDKILNETYKFPLYPFSFSNNVKKVTGKSIDNTYQLAYSELKKQFVAEVENRKSYEKNYLNHSKSSYYTDFKYPQSLASGKVIAIKSGLANIAQIVELDKNKVEKSIYKLGDFNDSFTLSAANNKVVWAEFMPDPRWEMRNFSNLKILDVSTGIVRQITRKTRLASPSLSPDGRKIIAVNTSISGHCSLQFINAESGVVYKEFENITKSFYVHPSWSIDGKSIIVVALLNNQKAIQQIDIETGTVTNLVDFSNNNYAHPVLKDSLLLYNNAQNGVDNIFLKNIVTQKQYQVTQAKFGAFNAVFSDNNKEIIFTDFTSLGHRVASIPLEMSSLQPLESEKAETARFFGKWQMDEAKKNFKNSFEAIKLPVKKYSKWNVLNINSWGLVANSDGNSLALGVDTQDLLSTTQSSFGINYNASERQTGYFAKISYQGLFPIFDLSFQNDGRKTVIPKGTIKDQTQDLTDLWRQQAVNLGIRLPIKVQRNKFYSRFELGSHFSHIEGQNYDLKGRYNTQIGGNSLQAITYFANFDRKIKNAKRDLGPRWAQSIFMYKRNTPFGKNLKAEITAVQGAFTFPGVFKHDNIRLKASYLTNKSFESANSYYFSSPITFVRGYEYSIFDKMTVGSVDYRFPIADPDFALGRLLYFQRIKGNIFTDFGQGTFLDENGNTRKIGYNSVGIDVSTIFNVMRMNIPIEMGMRFAYTPNDSQQQYKITPLIIDIPF